MAKRRSKRSGYDKMSIYMLYALILFFILQNIEVIIGYALLAALLAIPYFLLRWYAKNKEKRKLLQAGLDEIDRMPGVQFEQYLGALFKDKGYKVQYTPTTGDYGADLLLRKENRTIAIQAKRYRSAVGVKAVQEASGAKGYYGTNEAWVITNNTFTKNACNCAERLNVKLIDRKDLINLIAESKAIIQTQEKPRPI
ncbi:restriction endonuclease [Domibacillus robiginosus]|uniref:restriction endonuclease n=1 Tax=Domibacillus robiginosus TaxID=1071054 RepID=UPI000AEF6499|nr:restriction endonuclease [Domibacillus robiginosus]